MMCLKRNKTFSDEGTGEAAFARGVRKDLSEVVTHGQRSQPCRMRRAEEAESARALKKRVWGMLGQKEDQGS